jgi:hypothetical protein
MNSGEWITLFMLGGLFALVAVFIVWEFIQLYRKRGGNASARTLTQWVTWRAENGSKVWHVFTIAFPLALVLIGVWLAFHFEGLCRAWDLLCEFSKKV